MDSQHNIFTAIQWKKHMHDSWIYEHWAAGIKRDFCVYCACVCCAKSNNNWLVRVNGEQVLYAFDVQISKQEATI